MKRWSAFLLAVLLAASLTACGGPAGEASSSEEDTSNHGGLHIKRPKPDGSSSEEDPEKPDLPEVDGPYGQVIARFATLAADPEGFPNADGPREQHFLATARDIIEFYETDPLEGMGYTVTDLNGDGVEELVVGALPAYGGYVEAVWTLAGGKPRAVPMDEDAWYNCLEYGEFAYYKALGDPDAEGCGQVLGTFALSGDGRELICQTMSFTLDGENYYFNESGSLDPAESEPISQEGFYAFEPEYQDLPLTSFSGKPPKGADTPVSVQYLPEGMSPDYWVTLYDGDGAEFLLFTADSPVRDFTVLYLELEDFTETGATIFSAEPFVLEEGLDSLPEIMTADTPVAVQIAFMGTIPNWGVSYVDENGDLRRFAITQSGYDGSVLLEEADPKEELFILPGTESR